MVAVAGAENEPPLLLTFTCSDAFPCNGGLAIAKFADRGADSSARAA